MNYSLKCSRVCLKIPKNQLKTDFLAEKRLKNKLLLGKTDYKKSTFSLKKFTILTIPSYDTLGWPFRLTSASPKWPTFSVSHFKLKWEISEFVISFMQMV
jgi:hypothetical protein